MEDHEFTNYMGNLEMQYFGFLVDMGPEIFQIFLKHVVNVYYSGMVMFLAR